MSDLDRCYEVIKKPLLTEKASDDSAHRNAYSFRVPNEASKLEIRRAVEQLFDVKVKSVNTLRVKGKWKVRGRSIGRTRDWKKAMVVLLEGQTIEIL